MVRGRRRRAPACARGGLLLLGGAPLEVGDAQTAAVQRVGQVGEVAAEGLQLGQRLLALQPREPRHRQALHHLEEEPEERGYLQEPPPSSQPRWKCVSVPPFGTSGRYLPRRPWSAAPRGCICSGCCPEPDPSGRTGIRCHPTSRCCPATTTQGDGNNCQRETS